MDTTLVIVAIIAFTSGLVVGLLITFIFRSTAKKREQELQKIAESRFNALAIKALKTSSEQFLQLADQRFKRTSTEHQSELDGKKRLIDQQLVNITQQLEKVTTVVSGFENERNQKYGELANQLQKLSTTTDFLNRALADKSARGQWGERMADDILKLIGFQEGVNYHRQKTIEGSRTRPDFTFILPQNAVLNMDVKFPFDNYLKYIECTNAKEQTGFRNSFLKDVRGHLKTVAGRGYINVEQSTVDCVLIFIPNEQIYQFILSEDHGIIDEAISYKAILCSPLTLFAILAIVRQSTENFAIQASSREVLTILRDFKERWVAFVNQMDDVEKSFKKVRTQYTELIGKRQEQLDEVLDRVNSVTTKYQLDNNLATPVE